MINFARVVKVVDAVCDCIPVLSTMTNGAQWLYKSARKTNAAANPVKATWKDDIKIHVLNKTGFDNRMGMIPLIGNLTNFVWFILRGLKDDLMYAVVNNKTEVIKLCLLRHPLDKDKRADIILMQTAHSSTPGTLKLILESRPKWGLHVLICVLYISIRNPIDPQGIKASLILDYYEKHYNTDFPDNQTSSIIDLLQSFVEKGKEKTASRILKFLPRCPLDQLQEILVKHTFFWDHSDSSHVLTKEQLESILSRCWPCTLDQLKAYCKEVHKEMKTLGTDIGFKNLESNVNLNKQEIMDDFLKIHHKIIEELLKGARGIDDSAGTKEVLFNLAEKG